MGAPLSNIVEVPGSEVPDSSSYHSNDSTEYSQNTPLPSTKCEILPPPPSAIPFDEPKSSSTYPDDKEMTDDGYDVNRGNIWNKSSLVLCVCTRKHFVIICIIYLS